MRLDISLRWIGSLLHTRLTRRDLFALVVYGIAAGLVGRSRVASGTSPAAAIHSTLTAFLDTLLPEDEHSPAASRLGIADRILDEAERDALYARLVRAGCEWIDLQTEGEFAAAPSEARAFVVAWMAQADENSLPRRFFDVIRDHAVALYYSNPAAWPGTGLQRPPQPFGYPEIGQ